jgi:hypothetical protein
MSLSADAGALGLEVNSRWDEFAWKKAGFGAAISQH